MKNKIFDYQNAILNASKKSGSNITIFITSGFQMKGKLRGFDNYVVILEVDGKLNMIYKHAISTIIPSGSISLETLENGAE